MFLRITNLYKSFGSNTAVANVDFSLTQGQILCLLGPSGCGKTTLLRLIAGLEQPDSGEIHYDEQNVTHLPPNKRGFGMMFQDYALFPHKNVRQNIAFGLEMRGDSPQSIAARVAEMLALVELEEFADREIDQLSGGEQQRVALARALAPDPKLLLLDEPLGALDRALRERLMIDLRLILKRLDVTAVYVTHDQTEALAIGDVVAVMNNGRIQQLAQPQVLFNQPATPFVAQFLGFQNILTGTPTARNQIGTPIGTFLVNENLPQNKSLVSFLLMPDSATFLEDKQRPLMENEVRVKVVQVGFYGRYFQLIVQPLSPAGQPQGTALTFEVKTAVFQPGQRLIMLLTPKEIHIFSS